MEIVVPPPKTFASGKRVGRPPSAQNAATKIATREKVAFNRIASKRAQKILQAQTVLAYGTYHIVELFRDPKNPQIILERHIVRDIKRQEALLNEFEHGVDYVILEGTPPDWRAGDAILNRAWGKPKETLEIEGEVKFTMSALHLHAQEKREEIDAPVVAHVLPAPNSAPQTLPSPEQTG